MIGYGPVLMRNGVAPYLLLSYSVLCPHDRCGTLLLRNKEGPYTQLLYALPWWQLRVLSSKWIKIIHPCPLLFHCDNWGPCDHEEWRCFLYQAALCYALMTVRALWSWGMEEFPVLKPSLLFCDEGWVCCAPNEWRFQHSCPLLLCPVSWWLLRALC